MAVELAGVKLEKIDKISTVENAGFVSHSVPGLDGEVVQNMGRTSVRIVIKGIFYGEEADVTLEELRKIYKAKEAVEFMAEITGQAYFAKVVLERFDVKQDSGEPGQFSYSLTVAEYIEPPEPVTTLSVGVDAAIMDEARSFMDVSTLTATLPDSLDGLSDAMDSLESLTDIVGAMGSIPDVINPIQPLYGLLDEVKKGTENLDTALSGLKTVFGIS